MRDKTTVWLISEPFLFLISTKARLSIFTTPSSNVTLSKEANQNIRLLKKLSLALDILKQDYKLIESPQGRNTLKARLFIIFNEKSELK